MDIQNNKPLTTENLGWRILGIGENGGLELISDNPTTATVTLSGETGYLNAEEVLNTACNELYGKGQYAERARSLNVEDVNKLANYDPRDRKCNIWEIYTNIDFQQKQDICNIVNQQITDKHGVIGQR